jgi:hypothetical protein
MEREPVFYTAGGSTHEPGVFEQIFDGRPVSAYEVFRVKRGRLFVLEYVSASVTRSSSIPYPPENLNDYGAVGYKLRDADHFHFLPFTRSEPGGILFASQAIRLYIPGNAQVVVKVPLIPDQSGGAFVNVSGYYLKE